MGAKEDLVRGRLEEEKLAKIKRELDDRAREIKKIADQEASYLQLLAEMGAEATRIAALLEDADWSEAELRTFRQTKKHWWQRTKSIEYACLRFCNKDRALWMRSDGLLYIEDRQGYSIRRPMTAFSYLGISYRDEPVLSNMRWCLEQLRSFAGLESLASLEEF